MTVENFDAESGPLVNVLIPSYNRREYLRAAIASVVRQDYDNLEILVCRDGGEEIRDVVESFGDSRIVLIDRSENRGIPFTLNEGLSRAEGKYICYLGNDDLYYRNHVRTLVNALENETECGAAYSDLYRTYCRVKEDGVREVLSKVVEVSRDFERFVMLYFNHTLHVSLMHRRDLLAKAGPYNEELNVLIDWDLTRRLCFFTDFYHVPTITGEYYSSVGESDRVSVRRRQDENEYLRNVMAIRTTRPAKPWSKIEDVSIIFVTRHLNRESGSKVASIWRHTFYPYELYLPLSQGDCERLDTSMPNIVVVPVAEGATEAGLVDAALARCGGEYAAVVPDGLAIREFWLEDSLYALINSGRSGEGFELEDSTQEAWGAVLRTENLREARRRFADMPVRESLAAYGIALRRVHPGEIPFQFDQLLCQTKSAAKEGKWADSARMFERIVAEYGNEVWIKALAGEAYYKAGEFDKAAELAHRLNEIRPTVDTLLLEARVRIKEKNFSSAIMLLEDAEWILEGKEKVWT